MKRTRKFPARSASVSQARRFTRETLAAHPAEARDAIELMVSELATNCIRHASSGFEIRIEGGLDAQPAAERRLGAELGLGPAAEL